MTNKDLEKSETLTLTLIFEEGVRRGELMIIKSLLKSMEQNKIAAVEYKEIKRMEEFLEQEQLKY